MVIDSFSGSYRFLSNFFPCEIRYQGMLFHSSEAAYQMMKTKNIHLRYAFQSMNASDSKKAGAAVILRPDWDVIKVEVMRSVIDIKFNDYELGTALIATGNAELIEGNHWNDVFWGVCDGVGENNLGKLLMAKRTLLRKERGID